MLNLASQAYMPCIQGKAYSQMSVVCQAQTLGCFLRADNTSFSPLLFLFI